MLNFRPNHRGLFVTLSYVPFQNKLRNTGKLLCISLHSVQDYHILCRWNQRIDVGFIVSFHRCSAWQWPSAWRRGFRCRRWWSRRSRGGDSRRRRTSWVCPGERTLDGAKRPKKECSWWDVMNSKIWVVFSGNELRKCVKTSAIHYTNNLFIYFRDDNKLRKQMKHRPKRKVGLVINQVSLSKHLLWQLEIQFDHWIELMIRGWSFRWIYENVSRWELLFIHRGLGFA